MDDTIQNRILEAIYRRILQAHKEQEDFRVIVVLPLLPGFQVNVTRFSFIMSVVFSLGLKFFTVLNYYSLTGWSGWWWCCNCESLNTLAV